MGLQPHGLIAMPTKLGTSLSHARPDYDYSELINRIDQGVDDIQVYRREDPNRAQLVMES